MRKYKRHHNRKRRKNIRNNVDVDDIEPKNTFNEWASPRDGIRWTSPELCAKIENNFDVEKDSAIAMNDHELTIYKSKILEKIERHKI
jgi:hypothetical protein